MKIVNKILILLFFCITISGAKEYSQSEIYQQTCAKCHGKYAQGYRRQNAIALNNIPSAQLDVAIYQLDFDASHSSGTTCEKVGYKLTTLLKKDMKLDSKKMAKYIVKNFSNNKN